MGASKPFLRTKKLKALANRRHYLDIWIKAYLLFSANVELEPYSRPIYLPKPVFRYWALFPKDFLAKYERHVKSFQPITKPIDEQLRMHVGEPEVFWKLGSEALKERKFMEAYSTPRAIVGNEGGSILKLYKNSSITPM